MHLFALIPILVALCSAHHFIITYIDGTSQAFDNLITDGKPQKTANVHRITAPKLAKHIEAFSSHPRVQLSCHIYNAGDAFMTESTKEFAPEPTIGGDAIEPARLIGGYSCYLKPRQSEGMLDEEQDEMSEL